MVINDIAFSPAQAPTHAIVLTEFLLVRVHVKVCVILAAKEEGRGFLGIKDSYVICRGGRWLGSARV